MLEEHFPRLLDGMVTTRLPIFDDQRGELQWRQAEPFSALASFLIGGKLKFTWFLFSGQEPGTEATVLRLTEECLNDLAALHGLKQPAINLSLLRQRPLAVCTPWPPSASALEQRIVGNYAVCLADAFFEKVADLLRRSEALLAEFQQRRGGRAFRWLDN